MNYILTYEAILLYLLIYPWLFNLHRSTLFSDSPYLLRNASIALRDFCCWFFLFCSLVVLFSYTVYIVSPLYRLYKNDFHLIFSYIFVLYLVICPFCGFIVK